MEFDGKRLRKTMMRKTVDYNSSFINMLHNRVIQLIVKMIIVDHALELVRSSIKR